MSTAPDTNAVIERLIQVVKYHDSKSKDPYIQFLGHPRLMEAASCGIEALRAQTLRITELMRAWEEKDLENDLTHKRIAELEAELTQHQWHRVEDAPRPTDEGVWLEVCHKNNLGRWYYEHRYTLMAGWQGWTHWRYSSPPETSE